MPGAGTDSTKDWADQPAPVVVLVEPQLGENIGAAARAMGNFGLTALRLVNPRGGWPNREAQIMASGADRILGGVRLFGTLKEAIADCRLVLAATARTHDQAKPVIGADEAARRAAPIIASGDLAAFVFGRERNGLENEEIGLADAIVTLPVNPAFASLNLAQAVAVLSYEWFKLASGGALPFAMPEKSRPATREQLHAFFENIERELDKVEFFRPAEKHETMTVNLRNIFNRMQPTAQDIQTLSGVFLSIAQGRKGPARGGVLDGAEAEMLRAILTEREAGEAGKERTPVRGLARFLRRNPTDAERMLWAALMKDRRFASFGFKRQTPIGRHIADIVSFPLRVVIDLVPASEDADAATLRAAKCGWLAERGYRVIALQATEISADIGAVLERIAREADAADRPERGA